MITTTYAPPCPHCGAFAKRCEADVNAAGCDGRDDPTLPPDRRICAVTGTVVEVYHETHNIKGTP